MNINRLQRNTLLLLTVPLLCAGLGSCQREEFVGMEDREALVREGKYLSAARAAELGDPDPSAGAVGSNFAEGTPYRMVVVSGNQDDMDDTDQRADHIRMNQVVKEARSGSIPYIDFGEDAAQYLSFAPTTGETTGRKALDFYGFTYGTPENAESGYLQLEGESDNNYTTLYREETVTEAGLNDLLYGRLLNQRAATVGSSAQIPFRHAFSQLRFQALQTEGHDGGATGQGWHDIQITGITVTGTYRTGKVFLSDGKVQVSSQYETGAGLPLTLDGDGAKADRVGIVSKDYGIMTILPSAAGSLRENPKGENVTEQGYKLGLQVTIEGDQTGVKTYCGESATQIGETDRYTGTITIPEINNNLTNNSEVSGTAPLFLKAGYSYLLRLSFMDDRFLITVVQQVAEWIPGENQFDSDNDGTGDSQIQQIGQPIYFDGKLWLDRNLGADDYDAENGDFEHTVGYFYQQFRNIPYWPYRPKDYNNETGRPLPDDKRNQSLNEYNAYNSTSFKVYPMVSYGLLNNTKVFEMNTTGWYNTTNQDRPNSSPAYSKYAISDIPEEELVAQWSDKNQTYTFAFARHYFQMEWSKVENQPVPQGYRIPTAEEFRSIFPSTPLAGNYAFIGGGNCTTPSSWGPQLYGNTNAFLDDEFQTIRICVPYYSPDKEADNGKEAAWNHWKKIEDPLPEVEQGCWPKDSYYKYTDNNTASGMGPGHETNRSAEPEGDPAPGYCSVYVISREEGSKHSLKETNPNYQAGTIKDGQQDMLQLREWGTIYGIKKVGTSEAYRMRWTVLCKWEKTANDATLHKGVLHPLFYVQIDRYRCSASDNLTRANYKNYQWDNPVATTYFPISGLVEGGKQSNNNFGNFYNCGSECMYATSDNCTPNVSDTELNGIVVRMKGSAKNLRNTYISVVNGERRTYGMQLRLIQD